MIFEVELTKIGYNYNATKKAVNILFLKNSYSQHLLYEAFCYKLHKHQFSLNFTVLMNLWM